MDDQERLERALDVLSGRYRGEHVGALGTGDAMAVRRNLRGVYRWHRAGRIVGFGLGPKLVEGLVTPDVACRVYVRRKRAKAQIRPSERIPETIDLGPEAGRVLLDVVDLSPPRHSSLSDPHDVVFPGLSAGHCASGVTGSIGALVKRTDVPGAHFVLGASHVFANSGLARRGDPIIQPGSMDGGGCPTFTIGNLDDYEPLVRSGGFPNRADVALVRLKEGVQLEPARFPMHGFAQTANVAAGTTVLRRLGCRTGESHGLLIDGHFRTLFRHPVQGGEALLGFSGLLLYHGASLEGDSGGPLVTETGDFAGIHIGDAGGYGVGVPAWSIPARWNLELEGGG